MIVLNAVLKDIIALTFQCCPIKYIQKLQAFFFKSNGVIRGLKETLSGQKQAKILQI